MKNICLENSEFPSINGVNHEIIFNSGSSYVPLNSYEIDVVYGTVYEIKSKACRFINNNTNINIHETNLSQFTCKQ